MPFTKRSFHPALRTGILIAILSGGLDAFAQEEAAARAPETKNEEDAGERKEGALDRLGRAGARALDEALSRARSALESAEPALDEAAARTRKEARDALEAAEEALENLELSESLARGIEEGALEPFLDEALRAAEDILRGLDPDRLRQFGVRAVDLQKMAEDRLRKLEEGLRRSPPSNPVEGALARAGSKLARGLREALEELEPAPAVEAVIRNLDLEKVMVSALRVAREALRDGVIEKALAESIRELQLEERLRGLLRSARDALETETDWH